MERSLRPERFDADPNSPDASSQWKHWYRTFTTYLKKTNCESEDKLDTLVNHITHAIYNHIMDCDTFDAAVNTLQSIYVKPKNEIFARHLLHIQKQTPGETLDQFAQNLKHLSKDCNFRAVSAEEYRDDIIRDAFINGLYSTHIRQRLLEEKQLDFQTAFNLARSLDMAQKQSQSYNMPTNPCGSTTKQEVTCNSDFHITSAVNGEKCFFCGRTRHPRLSCPARDATCRACGKKGHFQTVCRSTKIKTVASTCNSSLSSVFIAAAPDCLSHAVTTIYVNGIKLSALIDTGSSESYVSQSIVDKLKLNVQNSRKRITMASTNLSSLTHGHCIVTLLYNNISYPAIKLSVLPSLCSDILLGHDFLKLHSSVQIPFGGKLSPLSVCGVLASKLISPPLFEHLQSGFHPVTTKSRVYSKEDFEFISTEVNKLLADGIIEPSRSPWRAQVLVTSSPNHKKRLVIDYSQTINRFTHLDAYPLPKINELITKVSCYNVFSTLDLTSAYHQVAIQPREKIFTAFEACGKLYQFCRIPFGVTNGVACFQRTIDNFIIQEKLNDTFTYVDNIIICGKNQQEHDANLHRFLQAAQAYGITFNEKKSILSQSVIRLLGFEVTRGLVKPDPERFTALRDLPPPHDLKSQQRVVGMFAYYSQWISKFSDKIHPLVNNRVFPLPATVESSFSNLKHELENAALVTIEPGYPLIVETDASEVAIAATLNQNGRPVAFFSRTLSGSERHHSSVEKEACAIVESVRKWRHYLLCSPFQLVTDQRSVAFMYSTNQKSKIKNEKIERWRLELSEFHFDIIYRPGKENAVADALSRITCTLSSDLSTLKELHNTLCHPGVTRMHHFVRSKNLPFNLSEIREMTTQCSTCAELKPRFFQPVQNHLVKATHPFERISVDFKGPLPSASCNRYLLTMVDEYSRFPFAFPCRDMTARTVINCFCELFSVFGMPSFVHSDRGTSFMSVEIKAFLHGKGIATSRTTPYNPQANGQVERLNKTLWKTITLALKSRNLPIEQWESVLCDALHSIRSLLNTTTNATPHERMFSHNRRSSTGTSLPSWLLSPGSVLLKRNVRGSKYEPEADQVELLESNPNYAHVRLPSGREETVALKHLAPIPVETDFELQSMPASTEPDINPLITSSPPAKTPTFPSPEHAFEHPDLVPELIQKQQRVHAYNLRNREA